MTKDEALRMALDALETELSIDWTNNDEFNASAEKMYEAIAAIKEALAKEKALQVLHSENERLGLYKEAYAQRTWLGLTDEEMQEIWWSCEQQTPTTFVKAIEAKLKEKNT